MKLFLSFRNTTFAALLFFSAASHAQVNPQQVAKADPVSAAVKEPLPAASAAAKDEIVLDGLKLRNEKMYQHFTAGFKNAAGISIFPYAKTTAIICMVDGIRNNILYTNKGKLMHTVRYYEPYLLPAPVSNLVEEAFPGYKMTYVAEVKVEGQTAHLVSIENKKKLITVRVIDGNYDVYQEFDKQQ